MWLLGSVVSVFALTFAYLWVDANRDEILLKPDSNSRVPAQTIAYVKTVEDPTPADDDPRIVAIKEFIEAGVKKSYPVGTKALRDVHAKAHGCVQAEFTVKNDLLPPDLRVGLFTENKTYPAWIRFSNGSSTVSKDGGLNVRGMALKVMNVPGQKVLPEESTEQTQDFLMVNGPNFFVENLENYLPMITKTGRFFLTHPHDLQNFLQAALKSVKNPLYTRYWSQTPYALGPTAIKFSAVPCTMDGMQVGDKDNPNRLRQALALSLMAGDACMNFFVQIRTDATAMPIDDPSVEWEESKSPFIAVAQIKIPHQVFDSPEQDQFCENLSFTPWHSLPEHHPIGDVNYTRKIVYRAISTFRHAQNGIVRKEPTP